MCKFQRPSLIFFFLYFDDYKNYPTLYPGIVRATNFLLQLFRDDLTRGHTELVSYKCFLIRFS